jgi:hypothetical protein
VQAIAQRRSRIDADVLQHACIQANNNKTLDTIKAKSGDFWRTLCNSHQIESLVAFVDNAARPRVLIGDLDGVGPVSDYGDGAFYLHWTVERMHYHRNPRLVHSRRESLKRLLHERFWELVDGPSRGEMDCFATLAMTGSARGNGNARSTTSSTRVINF